MAEGAGQIAEWTRQYRTSAHNHTRNGLINANILRLQDIDDLIKHGEKIQMSLQRMRDVVYSHQQTHIVEPPLESHYRPMNGYDHDGSNVYQDDGKGGAFPSDAKKRRGVSAPIVDLNKSLTRVQRAAPPGRCHSCNRAETPEWRRGPDGARTLCNACGLRKCLRLPFWSKLIVTDYAKLTRKMGGKNMTSSNLRPKSLGEGSPAA
jgi:hypothetical protein